jgi:hypothetical protein
MVKARHRLPSQAITPLHISNNGRRRQRARRAERCEDVHGSYSVSAERVIWRRRKSLQEAAHATTAFAAGAACYA